MATLKDRVINDFLDSQQKLLRHLGKIHESMLEGMLQIRLQQEDLYLKLVDQVVVWENETQLATNKMVDELKISHEKEINDQHTVALKMSLFRDYDKKISELQRELDYTKKQLDRANDRITQQSSTPTSLGPNPVTETPEDDKTTSVIETTKNKITVTGTKENASEIIDPVSIQRRKVKWRNVYYYYDSNTLEVFESETSNKVVGKKEEKKIVLFP